MRCAVALGLLAACLGLVSAGRADDAPSQTPDAAQLLANRIDELIAARWAAAGVEPAPPATDDEFLRRVSLDLAGRIPAAADVRAFLADAAPDKRRRAIDELLDGPGYVTHFTNVWRKLYLPEASTSFEVRYTSPGFEAWLKKKLMENAAYDVLVRELLTARPADGQFYNPYANQGEPTPLAFFQAKENKPENLAAATSRLFLGIRVECAQCHDHPFARWKREEFWSHAAFFAGADSPTQGSGVGLLGALKVIFERRELAIPGTPTIVQAKFLDGGDPEWKFRVPARETLATWLTTRENPYFAKAAANRAWSWLFGTGIVDPVDDFDENNPPSHPELLDELARGFAEQNFDLKHLLRAIALSRTYQLSSRLTDPAQEDPRLFARMPVRGLSSDQLFESLLLATAFKEQQGSRNPFSYDNFSPRGQFAEKFADQSEEPTERQTSILQALLLMNGQLTSNATALEQSESLAAIAEYPLFDVQERVEALYLTTLSRRPRPDELERFALYVAGGGPTKDERAALADVFWALLNSSEFALNR